MIINEQNKKFFFGGATLIVFLIGLGVGYIVFGQGVARIGGGFQDGWDAAKKRLSETGYAMPTPEEVTSVVGQVTEVRSDNITVKIRPVEPLADPALDTRTVRITGETKVYRITQKDPIAYQNEVQEYNRLMQQAAGSVKSLANIVSPQPFSRDEITLADIKQGDQITITAIQNIKESATFDAATITTQVAPSIVPPAPAM